MSFRNITLPRRSHTGCEANYCVRKNGAASASLTITVRHDVALKMKWVAGTTRAVLQVDARAGQARLLPQHHASREAKVLRLAGGSGRGRMLWQCAYGRSGEVRALFPEVRHVTELVFLEAREGEGLIFELPEKSKGRGERSEEKA